MGGEDRAASGDALDAVAKAHARYREERDRRMRPDGVGQYATATGALERYLDDPYIDAPIDRAPVQAEMDVLIIGAGFGGLMLATRLLEAGVSDVRLVEKGGDVGGTWYWNRYPGISCDVESYSYLPLLEETGYLPPKKYAPGSEILDHCRRIAGQFGLPERTWFQTEVTELRWQEDLARWQVSTQRGDTFLARFVCMSTGPLHRPKLPGVPGLETFRGQSFHTSRWDYAYTGGDERGGLHRLADKRVGVIGTGATGVQCIPHVGEWAKELYVFQRTPSSIDERIDTPTDADWAAALTTGWHRARVHDFTLMTSPEPPAGPDGQPLSGETLARLRDTLDLQKMDGLRRRVDEIVTDPATAERLKPYYKYLCKRPCFSQDYLPTFNRPNVTLVDTQGRGIERITEDAVVVGGVAYPVDCLIFATGFEFGTDYAARCGFETYGRGGVSQTYAWRDGVSSLFGLHSRGFPNRFIIGNAQQASTTNFTHMLDEMSRHLAVVLKTCIDRGVRTIEPSETAERDWVATIVNVPRNRAALDPECTPNYFNHEGDASGRAIRNGFYGGSPFEFIRILEAWRADGRMAGLELT